MAKKKFDDPIYILRFPRGAGSWIEYAFQGKRVTISNYRHGVVDVFYRPPASCSLGEFASAFAKACPRLAEKLADVVADEECW